RAVIHLHERRCRGDTQPDAHLVGRLTRSRSDAPEGRHCHPHSTSDVYSPSGCFAPLAARATLSSPSARPSPLGTVVGKADKRLRAKTNILLLSALRSTEPSGLAESSERKLAERNSPKDCILLQPRPWGRQPGHLRHWTGHHR